MGPTQDKRPPPCGNRSTDPASSGYLSEKPLLPWRGGCRRPMGSQVRCHEGGTASGVGAGSSGGACCWPCGPPWTWSRSSRSWGRRRAQVMGPRPSAPVTLTTRSRKPARPGKGGASIPGSLVSTRCCSCWWMNRGGLWPAGFLIPEPTTSQPAPGGSRPWVKASFMCCSPE